MVTFKLSFSEDEMISFFKSRDVVVTEVMWTESIPVYHNRLDEQNVKGMCVINPHNCATIPVSVAFEKVIYKVKNALLLDGITRLTVLEALSTATRQEIVTANNIG